MNFDQWLRTLNINVKRPSVPVTAAEKLRAIKRAEEIIALDNKRRN